MLRILVTGREGQVGWECVRSLQTLGDVVGMARQQCDLSRPDSIRTMLREAVPDLIVNTAAYTAVDRAESEPALARAVNAEAPATLADEARRLGASLIHLSTDYVFNGAKATPYVEDDPPDPLSVYGHTKLEGERAILASGASAIVLRTSWVYATRGHNFLRTIIRLSREREELRIVDDQWGAPTWARSIAEAIAAIVARAGADRESVAAALAARGGLYHLTAAGRTTWHAFAERILQRVADPQRKVRHVAAIATSDYPTPARRPANSVLCCDRLRAAWGIALPAWDAALELALDTGSGVP